MAEPRRRRDRRRSQLRSGAQKKYLRLCGLHQERRRDRLDQRLGAARQSLMRCEEDILLRLALRQLGHSPREVRLALPQGCEVHQMAGALGILLAHRG